MKMKEQIGNLFYNTVPLVIGGGLIGVIIKESHLRILSLCILLFAIAVCFSLIGLILHLHRIKIKEIKKNSYALHRNSCCFFRSLVCVFNCEKLESLDRLSYGQIPGMINCLN